jgi:hypothetical protein
MIRTIDTTIARPGLSGDAATSETFAMIVKGFRGPKRITAEVTQWGEEVFVTQRSGMLKDSYTEADRVEQDRLNTEDPVKDGDVISVNGTTYRVAVKGDYSDPAALIAEG